MLLSKCLLSNEKTTIALMLRRMPSCPNQSSLLGGSGSQDSPGLSARCHSPWQAIWQILCLFASQPYCSATADRSLSPKLDQFHALKADKRPVSYNYVVQDLYAHNCTCLNKPSGDLYVIFRGLRVPRGMVADKAGIDRIGKAASHLASQFSSAQHLSQ